MTDKSALPDLARLKKFASSREAVRVAAAKLSLQFDAAWPKAVAASSGPIDVIDMFSGCGGMSAGFLAVNTILPAYRLAMGIDIDHIAMATYKNNLGLDATDLNLHDYADRQGDLLSRIDGARQSSANPLVLIGCAPCQGFSSHRNAAGENDLRNSLFVTFAKAAAAIQPDAIIVENVPEITTDRYWPVVAEARRLLERAGYKTILTAHNMAEFGVPQNRFRAVMVGMRRPFTMPRGFLAEADRLTVRNAIGHLPRIRPGETCASDPMHYTATHRPSTVETIKAVAQNGGRRPFEVGPESLRRFAHRTGGLAFKDVYGRLWWDRPSITITGHARNPASGRFVHPEQHRGLSLREAALLQGFPNAWMFAGGLGPAFLQVGNAVPPPFAAFLATHLLGELFGSPVAKLDDEVDIKSSVGTSFARRIPALKSGIRNAYDPQIER